MKTDEKDYREIQFYFGSIDSSIDVLNQYKERGELVYGEFNGQKLYSDIDDLDSAYKKITGKTKAEFDEAQRKRHEEYEEGERKHLEAIPELTKEWIKKGHAILDKQYHDTWEKCVPIRLGDLYHGMELGAMLEIVKQLNAGCELEVAKKTISEQGHSGMSFSLVCSMVKSFCDRGSDFVSYVRN